ncbi:SNARE-associated protein Snapin, partial [Eudyptes filholi]
AAVGGAKMAAGSGGPVARELFAEGLLQFLRPAVRQLDGHVHAVRSAPPPHPPCPDGCRSPAQERLRRLNHSVAKETVRRKAMLEAAGGYPQGLPGK